MKHLFKTLRSQDEQFWGMIVVLTAILPLITSLIYAIVTGQVDLNNI